MSEGIDFDAGSSSTLTAEQKLNFFLEKWDDIELLIEHAEQTKELREKLKAYIGETEKEVKHNRIIRNSVTVVSIVVVFALLGTVGCFLYSKPYFFTQGRGFSGTALIVASISATFVLLVALIRGAFRTLRERNKDHDIPPHISQLIDAVKAIGGSGTG